MLDFTLSHIKRIHLELTEKCNAACPLCIRTNPDGLRPQSYIGNNELTLEDIHYFLYPEIRDQLVDVHMCGSYGDPIVAKDCKEIANYLCSQKCSVSLSTNGGARSATWWAQLGIILSQNPRSRVDFHIDGLADTNSFYRRNTKFERIITNARAFIDAGGTANWEFIPFRHNEHQVQRAQELSKEYGFARFTIKKSNWLFSEEKTKIPFTARDGTTHYLEAPSKKYLPSKQSKSMSRHSTSTLNDDIHCLALKNSELYISCEGIVYPCCWTARFARNIYLGRPTRDGFSILFKKYGGRERFDLRKRKLPEILDSDFLKILSSHWKEKKPPICYKKCGKKDQPQKIKTSNTPPASSILKQ
jgi:MoaA/NifB/PqqE/SkfB family radical SAM enzyme